MTPTKPSVGVKLTLHQAIDYDQLTPTQQARWDLGLFGSIELKERRIYHYYYVRWTEPKTGTRRSTYLHKDYDIAMMKLYLLLHPIDSDND